jgi:hypothetical protein
MLNSPSPRIKPLASTMMGVSLLPFHLLHHRLMRPPTVRANVNDGVLYMPIATLVTTHNMMYETYQQRPRCPPARNQSTSHSSLSVSDSYPRL